MSNHFILRVDQHLKFVTALASVAILISENADTKEFKGFENIDQQVILVERDSS